MDVLGPSLPADLHLEPRPACEWVSVEPDGDGAPCGRRGDVLVAALGDGDTVPADFLSYAPTDHWEPLLAGYARRRAWGSALVASSRAGRLRG